MNNVYPPASNHRHRDIWSELPREDRGIQERRVASGKLVLGLFTGLLLLLWSLVYWILAR